MLNSTFQVTFGIEVECILAFHEKLLSHHLAATKAHSTIVKDIPDDVRQKLNQVSPHYLDEDARQHDESRQRYMGWALTAPTAYPAERDNNRFQEHFDMHLSTFGFRAYGGEILHVAQTRLPAGVHIHDSFHSENKYTDFSHWHLTHERGLVGVDKKTLKQERDKFPKDKAPSDDTDMANDWDSHPLELVSRVLPYNTASLDEVHDHLSALQSGDSHFAFATKHCGLHVHVGLPVPANHPPHTPPPTFTLPTLQHLAYILSIHQSHLTTLHPASRSPATNIDLKSNLDNFHEDPAPLIDAEYDALDARVDAGEDPDIVYAQPPTFTLANARAKIFAPDMTVQKLSELMGGEDRCRVVNWKYVARMDGSARTIEFRQHAGTLCPLAIAHWTTFVVAMVRLAEHNGRKYGSGSGYDGEESSIWELMEDMELGEEEVEWWRGVVGAMS